MRTLATFVLMALLASPALAAEPTLAIRGGTVLTVTHGTVADATILVQGGRIVALGSDVKVPAGARILDARGRYVMPGIIDAHSHIALAGDVNEATSPVTPQLDMLSALDPYDPAILHALAGGVTATKLLHGSANVIGGVSVTVKLKWGHPASDMVIHGVRPQLKMALGENPKRTYGDKDKMPATRPGEMALIRQSFAEALDYKREWDSYRSEVAANKEAKPPKRDLKLETLAAVLDGKIAIDCHAYSAQEIVALLGIVEEYNLPLLAFSHALEAYKVRDLLAKRGVSVQTHTDWWGYKWEAYDAIPYAPEMLIRAGVNTVLISDSPDVTRRLNREAAKLLRHGGLSEDQALATITINPARALEIDSRTGSLEVGKDADLAIFDRHPLDSRAKCVATIVEGEILFDIAHVGPALSQ